MIGSVQSTANSTVHWISDLKRLNWRGEGGRSGRKRLMSITCRIRTGWRWLNRAPSTTFDYLPLPHGQRRLAGEEAHSSRQLGPLIDSSKCHSTVQVESTFSFPIRSWTIGRGGPYCQFVDSAAGSGSLRWSIEVDTNITNDCSIHNGRGIGPWKCLPGFQLVQTERNLWRPRSSKSGSIDGNSYKKIIGNPQAETQKNGFPFLFGNDFGSASVLFLPAAL